MFTAMPEPAACPPELLPQHPFGFPPSPLKETHPSDFQCLQFPKFSALSLADKYSHMLN